MTSPNVVERLRAASLVPEALGRIVGRRVDATRTTAARCPNANAHRDGDRAPSLIVKPEVGRADCAACGLALGLLDLGVAHGFGATAADVAARLEAELLPSSSRNGHAPASASSGTPARTVGAPAWPWFPKTVEALGWTLTRSRDGRTALRCPTYQADGSEGRTKVRIEKAAGKPTAEFSEEDKRPIGLLNGRALLDAVAGSAHPTVLLCAGESDVLAATWAVRSEGLDVPAVSLATGETSRVPPDLAPLFAATHVVVLYDADEAGRREGPKRAEELRAAGAASAVSIAVPRGGKDVCDFVRAGGTLRELLRIADQARAVVTGSDDGWDEPIPFGTHDVPSFPTDALPEPLDAWADAVAETAQVPGDLPGMLALATLAACCSQTAEFEAAPDWREPLNLYVLVAMEPGARKSAVFAHSVRPLLAHERDERERTEPARRLASSRHAAANRRVERAEKGLAEAEDADKRVEADGHLADALAALRESPPAPELRLVTDDATPERLAMLLAEQGGRIAVLSAEAALVGILAGRYSRDGAPSLDVVLKAHAGDALVVDRVGRETVRVDRPALTLGLAVQPEVIRNLVEIPGAAGRGLPQRFLFALPPSRAGMREVRDDAVPADLRAAFDVMVRRLLARPVAAPGSEPPALRLDADARAAFRRFRESVERRIADAAGSDLVIGWLSKLPGAVGRIAALLHVAEAAGRGADPAPTIGRESVERAVRVGEYLLPHARAAFSVAGADPGTEAAKLLLRWIERHPTGRFTERDALNGTRSLTIPAMRDVRAALRLLDERNYVRPAPEPQPSSPRGGRPRSPTWVRSPRVTAEPAERRPAGGCAGSARSALRRPSDDATDTR
jgi:replicative DNA helicase